MLTTASKGEKCQQVQLGNIWNFYFNYQVFVIFNVTVMINMIKLLMKR